MHCPLRLRCDAASLVSNFQRLQRVASVPAGAAIKADGYGLGARQVSRALLEAGCRDFFVSTWWEASRLGDLPDGSVAVLHGLGPSDRPPPSVRPVLISVQQVERWKALPQPDLPCDVMIDTGMNRLGLRPDEIEALKGLTIHTLHSHLVAADEDSELNQRQLTIFRALRAAIPAQRYSLANSAGIFLGPEFAFDLVRPGLALYGGVPRAEARGMIQTVVALEAQVIQRRNVSRGETVGYSATFTADSDMAVAVINIGYADGYWRGFSSRGSAFFAGEQLPVIGRVSMDLVTLDASAAPGLREGDWVTLDFELEESARLSGMSQYELLTGLGCRYERVWA
ncbi:alanine racemase [Sphingomonas sp. LHG3406-1]|uniref:alanine racemase n=1 Tax=Sphingomonas sp. LHG3406-1 TaxID=2804617 RepID=UPI002604E3F1|nr:alanine racemase [Sphingomonas sp. LHG3406-1]